MPEHGPERELTGRPTPTRGCLPLGRIWRTRFTINFTINVYILLFSNIVCLIVGFAFFGNANQRHGFFTSDSREESLHDGPALR
jgi:hypothetical protein